MRAPVQTMIVLAAVLGAALPLSGARAQGVGPSVPGAPEGAQNASAFAYQGQLRKNGAPVSGACDASFRLYDAPAGGMQLGGTVVSNALQVQAGLFGIALDFGWGAFSGEARWLEMAIGCGEAQVTLTPRTALRPAPYAFALPGLRTVPGNTDHLGRPTMNVVGGVVTGTYSNTVTADSYSSVLLGGINNRISAGSIESAIVGGAGNIISGTSPGSTIGGGGNNLIDSFSSYGTVAGGYLNRVNGSTSAISGGYANRIDGGVGSAVGGGNQNVITAATWGYDVIGGGQQNSIGTFSDWAVIGGGEANRIERTDWAAIGGGGENLITRSSIYGVIGGGNANRIDMTSTHGSIGGGYANQLAGDYATVAGGRAHTATGAYAGISGGWGNSATLTGTFVGGGLFNRASGVAASVGGGQFNVATGSFATVGGGYNNEASGNYSLAAGRRAIAAHDGSFVWGDSTNAPITSTAANQVVVRASNGVSLAVNAGMNKTVAVGERYRDNAIIAWGKVRDDGVVSQGYGIAAVQAASSGVYTVTLTAETATTTALVPTANAEVDNPPSGLSDMRVVMVNQISTTTFAVYIVNGSGVRVFNDFTFIVTGR